MAPFDDSQDLEATEEQLDQLRSLGIGEDELEGLSMADADELIAEMEAERDAAKFGSP